MGMKKEKLSDIQADMYKVDHSQADVKTSLHLTSRETQTADSNING